MKKIMYVSSSGGHYHQLISYMKSTKIGAYKVLVCPDGDGSTCDLLIPMRDTNANDPLGVIRVTLLFIYYLARQKPDLIISTGAAPGAIAVFIGRLFGIKSIWIDSMANASSPSLSGRLVRRFATVWVTQSKSVSENFGGRYFGKIFNIY